MSSSAHPTADTVLSLAAEIERRSGVKPAHCYQCGKCSAGCPMAEETTLRPHDVLRLVQQDARERLLGSESIWLCLTCEACTARCPNQVDPARVIDTLREMALASGARPPRPISAFHEAFLHEIEKSGRVFELGLVIGYKLRSGALFQDASAAPAMMARGKLGFSRPRIRGVDEVRRIFAACRSAGVPQQGEGP